MKILLKPSDIIERALWYKYEYYILEDEDQDYINKLVTENKEFEIPEKDALVIGLLGCVETDNLVHRFNQHIADVLNEKSIEIDMSNKKSYHISKNGIMDEIRKYDRNFPDTWNPSKKYESSLVELKKYIVYLLDKIDGLAITEKEFQGNNIEYVQSMHVKKSLNFNH